MSAPFGGVGLEVPIVAQLFSCGAQKRQQDHCEGIDQPQAVSPVRRADMHRSEPHAEAEILCVAETALDLPTLGIQLDQGPRGFVGSSGPQGTTALSCLSPARTTVATGYAWAVPQHRAGFARDRRRQPNGRGPRLAIGGGDRDIAAKADDEVELQFLAQHPIELWSPKPRTATMRTRTLAGRISARRTRT